MSLSAGSRLGSFEVIDAIGAGGMGEVYRAKDTNLKRTVAIKILPDALAEDPDRLTRFQREAEVLASLNHPNIAQVYGLEKSTATTALVMELVEGPTLADRIRQGPIPLAEALPIAKQIAEALEAAHEQGIIHRDLKPANIKVRDDGTVKVLDFGLAKLVDPVGADRQPNVASSATVTSPAMTGMGVILGTAAYMSPEQAKGKPASRRADIWAFGVVLYEMLAGRRPFAGEDATEIVAAILMQPLDLAVTPARVHRLLARCLEKDPKNRLRDIGDVWDLLEPAAPPRPAASRLRPLLIALPFAAVLTGAAVWLGAKYGNTSANPPVYQQLTFRRGLILNARFSADGQTIVYGAAWDGKPFEIFSTRPESPESRPLGLQNADLLSISPTGEMAIGLGRVFFSWMSASTLARTALGGGAPRELLTDVQDADWSPRDSRLAVVRRGGDGNSYRLEYPIGNVLYQTSGWISHPRISPSGDRIAFIDHPAVGDDNGLIAVTDLAGRKRDLTARYAGGSQGLAWKGDEIWYSAAENGTNLQIYALDAARNSSQPRLVSRIPGRLRLLDISRDGRVLAARETLRTSAFAQRPDESRERDISWLDFTLVTDISTDGRSILIAEEGVAGGPNYSVYVRKTDGSPAVRLGEGSAGALSPDGHWASSLILHPAQLQILPTGVGEAKTLPKGAVESYGSTGWFPDSKTLLIQAAGSDGKNRLYRQDLSGGLPQPLEPPVDLLFPRASPDGRWIAGVRPARQPRVQFVPAQGGEPRDVPGLAEGYLVAGWSADSRSLIAYQINMIPVDVLRVDIATGRRQTVRTINPADAAGLLGLSNLVVSGDERTYAYSCFRLLSDLYLIEGLR